MFEKMNNMKSWILLHTSWGKLMSLAIGFSVIVFLLSTALSTAVSHELYFFAVFIALPIYMLANRIGIREEHEATKKNHSSRAR